MISPNKSLKISCSLIFVSLYLGQMVIFTIFALKKRLIMKQLLPILLFIFLAGCSATRQKSENTRSMYYWRTQFMLNDTERRFLSEHGVSRLYVRFFDVVTDEQGQVVPIATIAISDSFPRGIEIIPTVFITNSCMNCNIDHLPQMLLSRVLQMCETHDLGSIRELQIDCDWTMRTQQHYFSFLESLRQLAKTKGISLSTTVRLHQLSQSVPPVDRGVLMMYNTGDFTRIDCEHPILDLEDVKQYMPKLSSYDLPMSVAYPLFTWRILFRRGRYVGIIHRDDELPVLPGDTVVVRQPDLQHILMAKKRVGQLRPELNQEVILYDLQDKNLTRFNSDDYEEIFNY